MNCVHRKTAFNVHIPWQKIENLLVLVSHNEPIQLRISKSLDDCSCGSLDTTY